MNITVFYANKRKAKSSTYSIAQILIGKLLCEDQLFEFYLPQDMPHICIGCYACLRGKEDKCGGYEYMKSILSAMEQSELIVFCSPTYVFHTPGQNENIVRPFWVSLADSPSRPVFYGKAGGDYQYCGWWRHEIHGSGYPG